MMSFWTSVDKATEVPTGELQDLKGLLTMGAGTDYYSRWARWFFVDRFQEPVKSFSP